MADSTKFLLSMFAGAVFGKNGFASGLTGFGAKIFDTGHGEFESMFIRRFLEVPELRYNRVVTPCVGVWIETLRSEMKEMINKSHPAWVCGLKLIEF